MSVPTCRWSMMEAEMHTARQAAAEAQATAQRMETDLSDLSGAYNSLERHAFELEAQLHAHQQQVSQLRQQLAQAQQAPAAAAPQAAKQEAQQLAEEEEEGGEEDDAMVDLLVCLGQEETKVAVLSARLRELGEDPEALIAAVVPPEDDEEDA
jgi:chromosome segregation ATPase